MLYIYSDIMVGDYVLCVGQATYVVAVGDRMGGGRGDYSV